MTFDLPSLARENQRKGKQKTGGHPSVEKKTPLQGSHYIRWWLSFNPLEKHALVNLDHFPQYTNHLKR